MTKDVSTGSPAPRSNVVPLFRESRKRSDASPEIGKQLAAAEITPARGGVSTSVDPTPQPHVCSKVAVRATTDAERAEALASGTETLARLIAAKEGKLRTLSGLLRLAAARIGQEGVWPKVAAGADGAQALATVTQTLARLVAEEEGRLLALSGLLRAALLVAVDPKTLDDPEAAQTWDRGLELLERHRHEDKAAEDAERLLGVVSGHRLFMSGGEVTTEGSWYPERRDIIDEQVAKHGIRRMTI